MSRLYGKPYYKVLRVVEEPSDWFWLKNEESSAMQWFFDNMNNMPSSHPQYSLDGTTWTTITQYTQFEVAAGAKVYMRSLDGLNEEDKYLFFGSSAGAYSIGGNLATLVNWQNKDTVSRFPDYFLRFFFNGASYITDASTLTSGNVTTAGQYSLAGVFNGATNLTSVGDFSSLTALEYSSLTDMFQGSGLTTGIDLSNVTSWDTGSMQGIYYDCADLDTVTAPNVQTWVSDNCGNWLSGAGSNVSGTKTAYVPDGVTIPTEDWNGGIPNDWTRVTY